MINPHFARWYDDVSAVRPEPWLRDWLTWRESLSLRLAAHSTTFTVQPLHHGKSLCMADSYRMLQLPRRQQVSEREVILRCDGQPAIYGYTVWSPGRSGADWPFMALLGDKPLGSRLFADPLVQRSPFQYGRLSQRHPVIRKLYRSNAVLSESEQRMLASQIRFFARRSVFRRGAGVMLVTEVFFPLLKHFSNRRERSVTLGML